ncbi:MAG: sulfotransferase [Phycisphaeraceae bacterium]|nr:MAG: sulfotransferase [Phycisphaeraceae bacterium]
MPALSVEEVVNMCLRAVRRGDTIRAVGMVRDLVRQAPNDPRSRMLQGVLSLWFSQPEHAIRLLEQVTFELTGDEQRQAAMHLARARIAAGDAGGALATIDPIAGEQDPPGKAVALRAAALIHAGRLDDAQACLDAARIDEKDAYHTAIARGRLALATGAEDPALADRTSVAIEALTSQNERVGVPAASLMELLIVLGELHARRGDDQAAAHLFKRSASLNPTRVDPRPYAQSVMQLLASWNPKSVGRAAKLADGPAAETERPLFIVGMPGGGPELAAALLTAHPAVAGVHDVEALSSAIARATTNSGEASPMIADPAKLTGKQLRDAADRYLERTDPYNEAITRVVDADPLNLHVLGVVAQMLPKARVVVVRRDPFDACFGCVLEHTNPRLVYASDPRTLAVFAGAIRRLEEHWISLFAGEHLPLRARVVGYADLLSGDATKGLFEFAGLDPLADDVAGRVLSEHTRWTAHGMGLRGRFERLLPELAAVVDQAEIGLV